MAGFWPAKTHKTLQYKMLRIVEAVKGVIQIPFMN